MPIPLLQQHSSILIFFMLFAVLKNDTKTPTHHLKRHFAYLENVCILFLYLKKVLFLYKPGTMCSSSLSLILNVLFG